MKKWTFAFLVFATTLQSCSYKQKEEQLAKRELAVLEKEKALMQLEQRLTLLESELREKKIKQMEDSTAVQDSLQSELVRGNWVVKMRCTETSCSGSAIGDTKTETWQIVYVNKGIVVNAFADNKLSRIYNGRFSQNHLEAVHDQQGAETVIRVSLELKDNKMEGTREVERAGCKILYSLTAERQNQK